MSIEITIAKSYDSARAESDRSNWTHRVILDTLQVPPVVTVWSGYGNGMPINLWNNRVRQIGTILDGTADTAELVAFLKDDAAQEALARIVAGHSERWDGHNHVGSLTDDGHSAEEWLHNEIRRIDLPSFWNAAEWLVSGIDREDKGTPAQLASMYAATGLQDGAHLDTNDLENAIRDLIDRAHDEAIEEDEERTEATEGEACVYDGCKEFATTLDPDGDPCCQSCRVMAMKERAEIAARSRTTGRAGGDPMFTADSLPVTHWFWSPGDTVPIDGVHPVTGRGLWSRETPEQIATRYPGAVALQTDECDRVCALAAREKHRAGIPIRTDRESFDYARDCLPPCRWTGPGGETEWFHISERQTGDLVDWWIRIGAEFWRVCESFRADPRALADACRKAGG